MSNSCKLKKNYLVCSILVKLDNSLTLNKNKHRNNALHTGLSMQYGLAASDAVVVALLLGDGRQPAFMNYLTGNGVDTAQFIPAFNAHV